MAFDVIFSPRAERHLQAIYDVVAMDAGIERADTFVSSIVDYCLGFDVFPERGARRDDLSPGLRIVGFKRVASIAFRVEGKCVVVHGVYYGGRNLDDDLRDRSP